MSFDKVEGRACAKFILLGEHFVVFGGKAVSFPLSEISTRVFEDGSGIKVESSVPRARGFGSSASYSVALVRFLSVQANKVLPLETEIQVANSLEHIYHKTPSGLDVTTIVIEKPILFQERRFEPIVNNTSEFIVVDSGQRATTAELVGRITEFREKQKERWMEFQKKSDQAVLMCVTGLKEDVNQVAQAVTISHELLTELQLVTPRAQDIITWGIECGALAGKISGAGSGGALVLVCRKGSARDILTKMRAKLSEQAFIA
ncbi:MAG: mevalonate kinase [Bacteriovoracia bacterium]